MNAFEEIKVRRKKLDPTLSSRSRQREGGRDVLAVGNIDDGGNLAVALELLWAQVEHRRPVAEIAAIDVDDDVAALALGLHRVDPLERFSLVEFDAQAG